MKAELNELLEFAVDLARTLRDIDRKLEQLVKLGFHFEPFCVARVPALS